MTYLQDALQLWERECPAISSHTVSVHYGPVSIGE
jgi:hypothetical protein